MYTSDKNTENKTSAPSYSTAANAPAPRAARNPLFGRIALTYTLITIFCALFGAVYEVFSHEVYSYYMLYAFAFPLVLGVLPSLLFSLTRPKRYPALSARAPYHFGVAILTVGSLMNGVLEIYGTTSDLISVYWIAGIVFLAAGAVIHLFSRPQRLAEKNLRVTANDRYNVSA